MRPSFAAHRGLDTQPVVLQNESMGEGSGNAGKDPSSEKEATVGAVEFDKLEMTYSQGDGVDRSQAGFWGNLSKEQMEILVACRKRCDEEGIDLSVLNSHTLAWQLGLLRFLRANKWVLEDTMKGINIAMEWRAARDVVNLRRKKDVDVLGVKFKVLHDYYNHWHCGGNKRCD